MAFANGENVGAYRIVEKLGLRLFHADVRWAAAMALDPTALPPARQTEVQYHDT